ncbi:MAG: hypothetical protein QW562_06425 [Thermosphaera sp.]
MYIIVEGLPVGLESLLSILVSASTLYDESNRVKVARGISLVGLALVISEPVYTVSARLNPYTTVFLLIITASLLFYAGVKARRRIGELASEALLRTTLCIYTGEECEGLVDKSKNLFEEMLDRVMELSTGRWSPLEEVLRMIEGHEGSTRHLIFTLLYVSMYYVSIPLSLSLLLSVLLMVSGFTESARPVVKTPLYIVGFVLMLLGFILSYRDRLTLEPGEMKREEDSHRPTPIIPVETLYRKMLLTIPRNRLERAALELMTLFFSTIPDFLKPKLDVPLVAINLYEFSPMLDTIINKVKKLWESDFTVKIKGSIEWMMEEPDKISGLEKFITLHDKKSPINIYRDLMLIGKTENKMKKDRATKIIVKETKRSKEKSEVDDRSERANLNENNDRVIAIVGLRAWKGCVKRYRIRSKTNNHERALATLTMEPRRVVTIFVVGRRDVVSTLNILISAYLRTAGMENVLCLDQDETSSSSSENDESRETRTQHSGH